MASFVKLYDGQTESVKLVVVAGSTADWDGEYGPPGQLPDVGVYEVTSEDFRGFCAALYEERARPWRKGIRDARDVAIAIEEQGFENRWVRLSKALLDLFQSKQPLEVFDGVVV